MQSSSALPRSYLVIVLAWCGILLAMFALTYILAEPYPTFVMPGFAHVFQPERDTMYLEEPHTWLTDAQNQRMDFSYQELWQDVHYVSPPAVMKQLFTTSAEHRLGIDTNATSLYMRLKRLRSAMQTRLASTLRRVSPQERFADTATRAWLRAQCDIIRKQSQAQQKNTSHQEPAVCGTPHILHIAWYKHSYTLRNDSLVRVRSVITDSVHISLHDINEKP